MKVSSLMQHSWIVAVVVAIVVIVWGACLYSMASQIGRPFPGFFYSPDRIVSAFTSFTGGPKAKPPWG